MCAEKIIFVNRFFYPDYSATSQILSDLAFDFARTGASVEVISSRLLYDDSAVQLLPFEVINDVRINRVTTTHFGKKKILGRLIDYATFYVAAAWMLWKVTKANTVVVVKTDPPLFSVVAALIVRVRGAKLINWLQDIFPEVAFALDLKIMRWPIYTILKSLRNSSLKVANTNIVIGHLMREKLLLDGIPKEKVKYIPNWADGSMVKPLDEKQNTLRKQWALEGKFVVGYSGNLGRAHEFGTILSAIEQLQDREDVVFLFIGGGVQSSLLEEEVHSKKLKRVLFKPYQAREMLSESLSVSDVHLVSLNPALESLIVPSKFYGIAAVGRPSIFIGDREGEIATVLKKFECGYSVSTGDHLDLVRKILGLANDPAVAISLGSKARIAFELYFDKAVAFESFKAEFDRVMKL